MTCFSDSPLAMWSGRSSVLMAHSKQSTSNSPGIMASNDSEGKAWFHYWINTIVFTTLDFPRTSGVQKLMMPYPAWLRRQDELTVEKVFRHLPAAELQCTNESGRQLAVLGVCKKSEWNMSQFLEGLWLEGWCDWPRLKILEKEKERYSCLMKVSVEQRLPGGHGSHVICLYFASCVESPFKFTFHMKVE